MDLEENAESIVNNYIQDFRCESAEVINRIKRTRDIVNNLKIRLVYEKELLAKEREHSAFLTSYDSGTTLNSKAEFLKYYSDPYFFSRTPHGSFSLSSPMCKSYSCPLRRPTSSRLSHQPDLSSTSRCTAKYFVTEETEIPNENKFFSFCDYLNEVEQMCKDEMQKIEENIQYLIKMKKYVKKLRKKKDLLGGEEAEEELKRSKSKRKSRKWKSRPDSASDFIIERSSKHRSRNGRHRSDAFSVNSVKKFTTIPLNGAFLVLSKTHLGSTSSRKEYRNRRKLSRAVRTWRTSDDEPDSFEELGSRNGYAFAENLTSIAED